jgi:hypothetical protein
MSQTPPVESQLPWSAGVVAAFGCYGAVRIAAIIAAWSSPVVVVAVRAYTLIQGLRNKLVVYASIKDVVLSLLAGTVMLAAQLTGSICTSLVGLLLFVISAIWSIRRNRSILTGLMVCLFKVTFAPCWLTLMLTTWFFSRSDDRRGASEIRPAIFCGLLTVLMWKLVNGRRHWSGGDQPGHRRAVLRVGHVSPDSSSVTVRISHFLQAAPVESAATGVFFCCARISARGTPEGTLRRRFFRYIPEPSGTGPEIRR